MIRYMIFEVTQEGIKPLNHFGAYYKPTKIIEKTYKLEGIAWKVIEDFGEKDKCYTVQSVHITENGVNINGQIIF